MRRLDLARQITLGVVAYGVLLSVALFVQGLLVNEQAERMVWEAMLDTSMTDLQERRSHSGDFVWRNNGRLDFYRLDADGDVPERLRGLNPGLHDEVVFDDNEWVVLVREDHGERLALAMDIDGFEALEWRMLRPVVVSSFLFLLLLAVTVHFGVRLLVRPLRALAARIAALSPDRRGQRVEVPKHASVELEVIATALNGYLERNDEFVERERAFLDMASHELRTPVTVIRSAAQVGLAAADVPPQASLQLQRIARTTREVEELIAMLLVLAKDPEHIRKGDEIVELHALLPEIIDAHRSLCEGKALRLVTGSLPSCRFKASESVLRVAIGNLVRNAIENSDRGEIHVGVDTHGMVEIRDPGHGMSPDEIAALYRRMAKGGDHRAGIGMALIARLCEHLDWTLRVELNSPHGTCVQLDLSSSRCS